MEQIMNYIKPELLVLSIVLYFIGNALKKANAVKNKYIPLILGGIGILLCTIWVISSCPMVNLQGIASAIFTSIVQGVLVAGLSTYVDQIIKQAGKSE